MDVGLVFSSLAAGFVKLSLHSGVATGEALDSKVFSLVIGKTELVFGAGEGIFNLLQVSDRAIYLINGCLELLTGDAVVASKGILEGYELVFEVGDIHTLATGKAQLLFITNRVLAAFTSSMMMERKNCGRMTNILG